MLSSTLTLLSVVIGVTISQVAAADPSAVPYNGYTCPALDSGNFPVGVTNYASDPIFCAYPLTAGSSDTTFNCQYSPVSHLRSVLFWRPLMQIFFRRPPVL